MLLLERERESFDSVVAADIESPVYGKRRAQKHTAEVPETKQQKLEFHEMETRISFEVVAASITPCVSKAAEVVMRTLLKIPEIVEMIASNLTLKELLVVRAVNLLFLQETTNAIKKKSRVIIKQKQKEAFEMVPSIKCDVCPLLSFLQLSDAATRWKLPFINCTLEVQNPRDKNIQKLLDLNLEIDSICLTQNSQGSKSLAVFLNILCRISQTVKHVTLCRVPHLPSSELPEFPQINSITVTPIPRRYFDGRRHIEKATKFDDEEIEFVFAFLKVCPKLKSANLPLWMNLTVP